MAYKWPVRKERPVLDKVIPTEHLFTGLRVLDGLFPLSVGGTCAITGPGCGKTMLTSVLARESNSDVVIYCGCGERSSSVVEYVLDFPELFIKGTGQSIMKKSCLIANTSNMPMAAREASIYTSLTISEYYRDMGYNTIMIIDSLSR